MSESLPQNYHVRVAVDPGITEQFGPEIHWTLRLLLTTIGWSWIEVPLGDDTPCDLAYVADLAQAPHARLRIQADPRRWISPVRRFESTAAYDGLSYVRYTGDGNGAAPVHRQAGQVTVRADVVFDAFWLATGQEERFWPKNDFGAVDLNGAPIVELGALRLALISQLASWLQTTLIALGAPAPLPVWPQGKRAAAAIGHDVDYPEVVRWLEPARLVRRLGQQGVVPALEVLGGQRHHWHFADWMALEQELQSRSAFYFVARRGSLIEYAAGTPDPFYDVGSRRFRELFRSLIDNGFEVGLHASYRACEVPAQFAAEKARLEEACGQPIVGNRHHYWRLNPANVDETLLLHEQLGFEYDASLTHDRYLGWRRSLLHPYFPFHLQERRELRTLQIPTGWMDDQLFSARHINRGDRDQLLQQQARRVAELGGCFLIDIHDYVWDDALYPRWRETFAVLWRYLVERGDFWFATPAQVSRHWRSRHDRLIETSAGLKAGRA